MNNDLLADLAASMQRLEQNMPRLIRPLTRNRDVLPRACMVLGPRGVGKTVFLLHHGKGKRLLYLSADNPRLGNQSLYETVRTVFMAGYQGVMVDEVHHARDWAGNLKALYDDFPQHTLWCSDSSALVLRGGVADTSRRIVPINLPFLSFREFLFLETGFEYPMYDAFAPQSRLPLEPDSHILHLFQKYREVGTRPFYQEGDFKDRMLAVLEKTLYADIPFFIPHLTDGNLRLMQAIIASLAASDIPRLQVRSLCADWGLGAEKLYHILNVMEAVGLLRIIRPQGDTKAKTVGDKLFFADPVFYSILGGSLGTAREAMVASLCTNAGWHVTASRDETQADFVLSRPSSTGIETISIEVGGSRKSKKNANWVVRDDLDYPSHGVVPLWLLAMSY